MDELIKKRGIIQERWDVYRESFDAIWEFISDLKSLKTTVPKDGEILDWVDSAEEYNDLMR